MYLRLFLVYVTSTSQTLAICHVISPAKSHSDRLSKYHNRRPFLVPKNLQLKDQKSQEYGRRE